MSDAPAGNCAQGEGALCRSVSVALPLALSWAFAAASCDRRSSTVSVVSPPRARIMNARMAEGVGHHRHTLRREFAQVLEVVDPCPRVR